MHEAFRALGPQLACQVALNLEQYEEHEEPMRSTYRAMLVSAVTRGTLDLDGIQAIREHRARVVASCPTIHWDKVFAPGADAPTLRFYGGSPRLRQTAAAFVSSLKELSLELAWHARDLHLAQVDGKASAREPLSMLMAQDGPLSRLLREIGGWQHRYFNQLAGEVREHWDQPEPESVIDQELMSRLITRTGKGEAEKAVIAAGVSSAMAELLESLEGIQAPEGLRQSMLALKDSWAGLAELVEQPGFTREYKLCGDFELSMVKPDDVRNLRIPHEVSCCLAPDGDAP